MSTRQLWKVMSKPFLAEGFSPPQAATSKWAILVTTLPVGGGLGHFLSNISKPILEVS